MRVTDTTNNITWQSTQNLYDGSDPTTAKWTDWEKNITDKNLQEQWKNLSLSSGIVAANNNYGGRSALGYSKIGNIVYLAGGIGITDYDGEIVTVSTLPSGYRPATSHYYLCPLNGTRIARVFIKNDGSVNVEWILNIADGSDYTGAVSWIDISTWFSVP